MKKTWILGLVLVAMFMLSGTVHARLWGGGWWDRYAGPIIDGIHYVFNYHPHVSHNPHSYDSSEPQTSSNPTATNPTPKKATPSASTGSECKHPKPVTSCDTKHGATWGGCCGAEICCGKGCEAVCNDAGGIRRSYCDCAPSHVSAGVCRDNQGDQYPQGACITAGKVNGKWRCPRDKPYMVCDNRVLKCVSACPGANPPMKGGATGTGTATTAVPASVNAVSYTLLHDGKNPEYPVLEVRCNVAGQGGSTPRPKKLPKTPRRHPLTRSPTIRLSNDPTIQFPTTHKKTINKQNNTIDTSSRLGYNRRQSNPATPSVPGFRIPHKCIRAQGGGRSSKPSASEPGRVQARQRRPPSATRPNSPAFPPGNTPPVNFTA